MIQHAVGLLVRPTTQWRNVSAMPESSLQALLLYPWIFAILPAVAWYYGTSHIGWTVGDNGETIRLTRESARLICILFYLTMIACVTVIGYAIHWMAATYGAQTTVTRGIVTAGLIATPMFFAGAVGFYPILWLDMLIGVVAISWSVYLMYLGIPIMMGIPQERGFLYASAVLAIAMVILICLMVGSVMLWEFGAAPTFTD